MSKYYHHHAIGPMQKNAFSTMPPKRFSTISKSHASYTIMPEMSSMFCVHFRASQSMIPLSGATPFITILSKPLLCLVWQKYFRFRHITEYISGCLLVSFLECSSLIKCQCFFFLQLFDPIYSKKFCCCRMPVQKVPSSSLII